MGTVLLNPYPRFEANVKESASCFSRRFQRSRFKHTDSKMNNVCLITSRKPFEWCSFWFWLLLACEFVTRSVFYVITGWFNETCITISITRPSHTSAYYRKFCPMAAWNSRLLFCEVLNYLLQTPTSEKAGLLRLTMRSAGIGYLKIFETLCFVRCLYKLFQNDGHNYCYPG